MQFETLHVEISNGICAITINRPAKLNALNAQVFSDLESIVDHLQHDENIKCAYITGSGEKAFVAGADISEFAQLNTTEAMTLAKRGQDIFFKIENSSKPIVAAVNGFALGGGCELAMACHFRICADNAKFGQPEVNLGLIPGYGGTQRLTQLIGKGRSMQMQMTAAIIDSSEALRMGLANEVTGRDNLINRVTEILNVIQSKAPVAISHLIKCINAVDGHHVYAQELSGYEKEISSFGACFGTEDMKEGTQAFMEKRKADFKGK